METGTTATTSAVGVNPENKPAATLVSGLAALTAVFSAAGINEGVIPRMVREEQRWFIAAVVPVLLAGLFGVMAALFATRKKREKRLLIASNVALLVGLTCGLVGATLVWSSNRVPSLTAAPQVTSSGTFLNVTVKDSGLDSREHLTVLVEPLRVVRDPHAPGPKATILEPGRALYSASLGSDEDGKIDQALRVRLRDGYQGYIGVRAFSDRLPRGCYVTHRSDACISAKIVSVAERPQLVTHWGRGGKWLRISLRAGQIYGRQVRLRVLGRKKTRWHELAYWLLAPSSAGTFSRTYAVRGIRRYRSVCIVASTAAEKSCPAHSKNPRSVWVRYRIPARGRS